MLDAKHKDEIHRIITEREGVVVSIHKVSLEESPFTESNNSNYIYKISYEKNNRQYTAWYRSTKVVNNIHSKDPKAYPEQWIFEE